MLVTFALQRLGQGNVSEEQINLVKQLLANEPKERIVEDLKLVRAGYVLSYRKHINKFLQLPADTYFHSI